jgi:integrase
MHAELCQFFPPTKDGSFNFWEPASKVFLFRFGKLTPIDPTRAITDITGAWDALRKRAGVKCRFHDLRHRAATRMAEAGVPESTMLALNS